MKELNSFLVFLGLGENFVWILIWRNRKNFIPMEKSKTLWASCAYWGIQKTFRQKSHYLCTSYHSIDDKVVYTDLHRIGKYYVCQWWKGLAGSFLQNTCKIHTFLSLNHISHQYFGTILLCNLSFKQEDKSSPNIWQLPVFQ